MVGRPGGDLLSHALRRSTIGAEGFHDRVRDGIGCRPLAITTKSSNRRAGRAKSRPTDPADPTWVPRLVSRHVAPSLGAARIGRRRDLVLCVRRARDQANRAISTG